MNYLLVVLFILFFVVILCLLTNKDASFHTKEGLGGGFAATSGLSLYNHQSCWKDPDSDSDQIYCTTTGRVMF